MRSHPVLFAVGAAALCCLPASARAWTFTDVTAAAGVTYLHGYVDSLTSNPRKIAGGVAVGDYDGDGWFDLYVVAGDVGPNRLFRNQGDGTFTDVGAAAGVALTNTLGSGPTFCDWDGDGDQDLFVGGIESSSPCHLFRNEGDGTFTDVTAGSGLNITNDTFSASFGDYDGDGRLDLATTHWGVVFGLNPKHLWRNLGNSTFTSVDAQAGLNDWGPYPLDFTFAVNFADIDSDGRPDLLVAADFSTSRIYSNDGDGTFTNATSPTLTDENAMGAGVADYDNDGDLDWFVSCIWDPNAPAIRLNSGNRLYRNFGDGTFEEITDQAGVRYGYWGWAASFADFDNDGWLDLYHVNGWYHPTFASDPARLWRNNGDGTFTEISASVNADHTGQGRGLACFDYDRDGDLDIFIANNYEGPVLYRNDGGNALNRLDVLLRGNPPNREAVGARIRVTTGSMTQLREVRAGCNFVSQDPSEAHFGLGNASVVDVLEVTWPDGSVTVRTGVPGNQVVILDQTQTDVREPAVAGDGTLLLRGTAPNPAMSRTEFRFQLGRPADVTIRIFNAAGRPVREITGGRLGPGEHTVSWDGRTADGAAASAGVYFYEVSGAGQRASGKITLFR